MHHIYNSLPDEDKVSKEKAVMEYNVWDASMYKIYKYIIGHISK